MDIKLRNLYVDIRKSQDSAAFTGDLYINGYKAAIASNEGHGGAILFQPSGKKGQKLLEEAEKYCKVLPAWSYSPDQDNKEVLTVGMNLEIFVDNLVSSYVDRRQQDRFQEQIARYMTKGIVYGIPDKEFAMLRYPTPLQEIFNDPGKLTELYRDIHEKLLPSLDPSYKILNTNIPENVLSFLKIPPQKMVSARREGEPKKGPKIERRGKHRKQKL